MTLGIEMEGGMGTPLAGRIVVAAVFDGGVAVEQGRWDWSLLADKIVVVAVSGCGCGRR